MQTLKELTNFVSYVQKVYPLFDIRSPRFGLVSYSKATKSFFLSFLLGFSIFPPEFCHKLKYIEIVLDEDKDDQKGNEYTFSIQNIEQDFTDLQEFQTKLLEYISSIPEQGFSESLQINIRSKNLPCITLVDLPEIDNTTDPENEDLPKSDEQVIKKKCVKDFIQDENNLILYLFNEGMPEISETKFIEYIRKYDVDCLRSLLIFDDLRNPDDPTTNRLQFHEIQKCLLNEELKPKFGFTLIKRHSTNAIEVEDLNDKTNPLNQARENNDRIWCKLRDVAQYALRRVFPNLLDQFKATASTLQHQLKNVVEEADRKMSMS